MSLGYTEGMGYVNSHPEIEVWTNFEGVEMFIKSMDHQHLSNIIHFMKYVNPNLYMGTVSMLRIKKEIDNRFNGEILHWRPLRRFTGEMEFLQDRGWLHKNKYKHKNPTDIIIDGQWIGEVEESNI